MPLKIIFNEFNADEENLRFYLSASPLDPANLPAPTDETGDSSTLTVEPAFGTDAVSHTVAWDETSDAYIRVSAVKGSLEVASAEFFFDSASAPTVPTSGLDLWYPFDDVSGTTVPDSANSFDGTLVDGPVVVAGDLDGSAVQFDGQDDYIRTTYKTNGGSYTISAWVNLDSVVENAAIYAEVNATGDSQGALFWVSSQTLTFGHMKSLSGDWDPVDTADVSGLVDRTIHVCAVRENGVAHRIYINGSLAAEGPCGSFTGESTFFGTIGGNPDYEDNAPAPRWLEGLVDRDYRIYGRALTAAEVSDLHSEHATSVSFVLSENFTTTTECEDISDFTVTAGSPIVSGSEVVLRANSLDKIEKAVSVPQSGDFLFYFKLRTSQEAGKYAYLQLYDGASRMLNFVLNYSYSPSGAEIGSVAVAVDGTTYQVDLEAGVDTSVSREYAIHADRDRGALSFYLRDPSGGWILLNHTPWVPGWLGIDKMVLSKGGASDSIEVAMDYFSVGRPNFVSIGDSITAGHNFFDPDPDFYSGIDDVKNSWQGHWNYAGLRNNFMVNKGIGNQGTAQMLSRIGEATSHGARYVFLSACNNDFNVPTSLSARTDNLQGCINAINLSGARCVLYNAVYQNSDNGGFPENPDYYIEWWNDYRPQITGTYQQINNMAAMADGTGYIDPAYCESDGVHPNATGYAVMGDYLETEFSHVA